MHASICMLGLLPKISNVPEQALGGCPPIDLGLVVEDRPLDFSCILLFSHLIQILLNRLTPDLMRVVISLKRSHH